MELRSESQSRKRGVCYYRADGGNIVGLMEVVMVVDGLERAVNKFIPGWRYC